VVASYIVRVMPSTRACPRPDCTIRSSPISIQHISQLQAPVCVCRCIGSWFREQYPKQNHTFQVFAIEADPAFHPEYAAKRGVTLLPYAAWVKNVTLKFETPERRKRLRPMAVAWAASAPLPARRSLALESGVSLHLTLLSG
jgi:hypothetical protein